jgi:hypothetical protein
LKYDLSERDLDLILEALETFAGAIEGDLKMGLDTKDARDDIWDLYERLSPEITE